MSAQKPVIAAILLGLALALGICLPASADDWEAVKLRGAVFALVDNKWEQLERGDVVPDERIIRTAPNSRVQFRRGKEKIDLGPDTQIRIFDRDGPKFTVVQEHFGDVAIEAERRNVQHFVVQTQYLAAVVKDTRFSVKADRQGAEVKVTRGRVEVRDVAHRLMVEVSPGQSASVGSTEVLSVRGSGNLAPIVKYVGESLAVAVKPAAVVNTSADPTDPNATVTSPDASPAAASVIGTPAVSNVTGTPAASVVANTPAASKTTDSSAATSETGTPAVSNTAGTPAESVVANTPAATNTPPEHSNAGGKSE